VKIEFIPSSKEVELVVPPPKPAGHYIPQWYKDVPKFSEKRIDVARLKSEGPGLKHCVPFLDGMISGYIQETWQDIVIGFDNNMLTATSPSTPEQFRTRDKSHLPMGDGFYNIEFVWNVVWIPKLPKGWSLMFTSPLNHSELPFQCATGIVDSDEFYHSPNGNYPFYVKRGFTGVIPAGTPMYQLIPFKRENWDSVVHKFDNDETMRRNATMRGKVFGAYRDFYHVGKWFK
jgi:hypothetical protein